ncbi:parallel beta-helix repeat protein [Nitrosospira multiformis]|uniref:Parallel beta-helix repeat protein n=2 Tax=Nitrosospira multiformis TaxID=1231 RepID=A0A2T5IB29_9PROT|nr:parallel beta-helix repeat protein [Nitrosospira multiformis]
MQIYEKGQETTRSRAQSTAKILKVAASRATFNIKAIGAFLVCFLGFLPSVFATTYYINSELGDDSSTGKQPVASGSSKDGPWQTLGRLASASLLPGDTVYLACGSVWNETLRIASSGTATAPVVISAGPGQCDVRPTIDGAVTIPPHMWKQHAGHIYRARLPVEHIANTAFSEGINGWNIWSARNDASIGLDTDCSGLSEPCLAFMSGTSPSVAISSSFAVAGGVNYSASLRVKAPAGTRLRFAIRRAGSSYESLAPDQSMTASGVWQTMKLTFRASSSTPKARLDIEEPGGKVKIYLREVSVRRMLPFEGVNEVFVDGAAVRRAHHPNFGWKDTNPDSAYAPIASDGGKTTLDTRNLELPNDGSLTSGLNVSIRTAPWILEERRVASVSGSKLTLDKPTTYSIKPGYGYFLTGALWMVDSPGEWHFDSSTGDLYIWMPDDSAPGGRVSINSLPVGGDFSSKAYIDVAGLAIRHVTTGVRLNRARSVNLKYMVLSELDSQGVEADRSSSCAVESSSITNTGLEAIRALEGATGFSISDSSIINSGGGRRTDGWRRLTRGPAKASIDVNANGKILGNKVLNSANNGVFAGLNSVIKDNYFGYSCLRFNDCSGIYTNNWGNNSSIIGNVVETVVGDLNGLPEGWPNHAVGIYLDEVGTGHEVRRNTVTNAEYGLQIHNASRSIVADNLFFGNRRYQLWLQERTTSIRSSGDIFENRIESNTFVPTVGGPSIVMESEIGDTADFATFHNNYYSTLISPRAISELWPGGSGGYTVSEWQLKGREEGPQGTEPAGYAAFLSIGSNIIPNGDFGNGSSQGWTWWTKTASRPQTQILSCSFGPCLQITANSAPASLSSPNFSVIGEQWYRVTFDAATTGSDQPINVVVLRGGGGTAPYELLMPAAETFSITPAWRRYSFLFRAAKTVIANDPATGESGARADFGGVQPGTSLMIGKIEAVPVRRSEAALQLWLRLNSSKQKETVPCAQEDEAADLCGKFVHLKDGQLVNWSSSVEPLSGEPAYTRDISLQDEDGDGVASVEDVCPNTQQNKAVNAQGCALDD